MCLITKIIPTETKVTSKVKSKIKSMRWKQIDIISTSNNAMEIRRK